MEENYEKNLRMISMSLFVMMLLAMDVSAVAVTQPYYENKYLDNGNAGFAEVEYEVGNFLYWLGFGADAYTELTDTDSVTYPYAHAYCGMTDDNYTHYDEEVYYQSGGYNDIYLTASAPVKYARTVSTWIIVSRTYTSTTFSLVIQK